jgi:hypothetical protein
MLFRPAAASADVVLDWNALAVTVTAGNPFTQARFLTITQLAVFEAVNAVTGRYEPYLGTVVAPDGASAEAAAIAAAYRVLKTYFPTNALLDSALANSLAAIPDAQAKTDGIATGEAAAAAMILLRASDGSAPPAFYLPESTDIGVWQLTATCPAEGGVFFQWRDVTPFGVTSVDRFISPPPPALTSRKYTNDYLEVQRVGGLTSTERPQDRSEVAQFYAAASPGFVFNSAARQVSVAQGRSLSHNARALALVNMAINDSLVTSFATKYHYNYWRPETAIRYGEIDGNRKTKGDMTFVPFIATPCFPSYPSNHASGSYGGAEILRRIYGEGPHAIELSNPALGLTYEYTTFSQITDDIDDARVYGGIHFRFDQEAGGRLGRSVAGHIYRHNLRRDHHRDHDHEEDCDDEHGRPRR